MHDTSGTGSSAHKRQDDVTGLVLTISWKEEKIENLLRAPLTQSQDILCLVFCAVSNPEEATIERTLPVIATHELKQVNRPCWPSTTERKPSNNLVIGHVVSV